jgi:hypothetical protein
MGPQIFPGLPGERKAQNIDKCLWITYFDGPAKLSQWLPLELSLRYFVHW